MPLDEKHDCSSFECGKPILDDWFRRKARQSEGLSARTFVACHGAAIAGYYTISGGAIVRDELPTAKLRRNQPDHVPVIIIARLGVDKAYQRQGIGSALLKDALLRALNISREVGFRAVLVHALDDSATEFYRKYGFISSPVHPRTMILALETVMRVLRGR